LKEKENTELLNNLNWKFAMYSEVYSPKDELQIFQELFDYAIFNNKKIHIVWVTLKEELDILEKYYEESWYLRKDVNCFIPDFSKTLVSVSVNIENLMWRWSDYKANWKKIFFVPPIRESGQNKAMFKGINRGSVAGINLSWKLKAESWKEDDEIKFLQSCIKEEKILPLTLAKVLKYNLEDVWFRGNVKKIEIEY
jgi:dihydroorotase-like cyclic amidohydrolase